MARFLVIVKDSSVVRRVGTERASAEHGAERVPIGRPAAELLLERITRARPRRCERAPCALHAGHHLCIGCVLRPGIGRVWRVRDDVVRASACGHRPGNADDEQCPVTDSVSLPQSCPAHVHPGGRNCSLRASTNLANLAESRKGWPRSTRGVYHAGVPPVAVVPDLTDVLTRRAIADACEACCVFPGAKTAAPRTVSPVATAGNGA
jgi:hypothetical protein